MVGQPCEGKEVTTRSVALLPLVVASEWLMWCYNLACHRVYRTGCQEWDTAAWSPKTMALAPGPGGLQWGDICWRLEGGTWYIVYVKVAQSRPTLCDPMDYSPWNSQGQNTGVGSIPLQRIFPTQGSNPGLPHCRQILYHELIVNII